MILGRLFDGMPAGLRRHKAVAALVRLFPALRIQQIRFNGYGRALVDLADNEPRAYFLQKNYDPDFFTLARHFVERGGVWVDVGANYGLNTFGVLGLLPEAPLDCRLVDANPGLCDLLRRSQGLHPGRNVQVVWGAVAETPGHSLLQIDTSFSGKSQIRGDGGVEVPNVVLDDYFASENLEEIAFLKMDVEGSEPRALRGARRSLREGKIRALFLEVSSLALGVQGFTVRDILDPLREANYRVFYCRHQDGEPPLELWMVQGRPLALQEVDEFSDGYVQTDVLALHPRIEIRKAENP
jgi:FkbM family methyltransferase